MEPLIYIVLINYKGTKDTVECVQSIRNGTYNNYIILIVDNASPDNSVETLKSLYQGAHDVRLIFNKENVGFAKANNLGISYAMKSNADEIILLNNDTIVEKEFLDKISKIMTNKDIDVLTCRIDYYDSSKGTWYGGGKIDWKKGYGIHFINGELGESICKVSFISGCCLCAKRKIFEKFLLPEDYFMYFEDVDYSQWLQLNEISMYYDPNIRIWHKVSASSGIESDFYIYYWNRNRLILIKKYKQYLGAKYYWICVRYFATRFLKVIIYLINNKHNNIKSLVKGMIDGINYKV